jgi:glycosyltransferase involved in cell wall biosynthesis
MIDRGPVVGVLPALGSGLTDLRRTGQHERFLGYDLSHYARAFEEVHYFSYFDERLEEFTVDPVLRARVRLHPNRPRLAGWPYALWLPIRHRRQLSRCPVLRVEQFTGAIPALLARALWGIPFVLTYGYDYDAVARASGAAWKGRYYSVLRRLAIPRAAAVIVPNPELGQRLFRRWPSARFVHLPNGIDAERFAPSPPQGVPTDERVVTYVGRLSVEKNLTRLVEAVAHLRDLRVRLVLIGDGPEADVLRRRARETGARVEFAGVVPHSRLPERLTVSDCFVLPSLTEGHPKALIEAMSCGLPCVVSDRGGNRLLVADGENGLSFDPEDVEGMVAQIRRVLTDQPLARRLGKAARERVLAEYDVNRLMALEVRLVMEVAANRSR